MLRPSYSDLMSVINQRHIDDDINIKSRYSIIIAASKRARQIIDSEQAHKGKPVSLAIEELYKGDIDIK